MAPSSLDLTKQVNAAIANAAGAPSRIRVRADRERQPFAVEPKGRSLVDVPGLKNVITAGGGAGS